MSFGWEVSALFAAFQIASLLYIFSRNAYIDRWYCLIILPFLGQEILQLFLWGIGDIETATATDCTPANRFLSKVLIIVVYSIPVCISIFSFATSQFHPKELSITISWTWKWMMVKDINLFAILCILSIIDNQCVTVGPNGHQNWNHILTPHLIKEGAGTGLAEFIMAIFFYPSMILTATLYKPLWVTFPPFVYAIICMILMCVFLGSEAWSVWSWACAAMTFWCLLYVRVTKWMIRKYNNPTSQAVQQSEEEEQKESESENVNDGLIDGVFGDRCIYGMFLEKTQQHFVRYGLMPDDDTNKFLQNGRVNFKL